MPQLDQLSACPSCEEPLEQGDRYCGACGTDLSAAAGEQQREARGAARGVEEVVREDRPTLPFNALRLSGTSSASGQAAPAAGPSSARTSPSAPSRRGEPTQTEPDFTLPPARPQATPEGEGPAGSDAAPATVAAEPPSAGEAVASAPDPRAPDPRRLLDDSPEPAAHSATSATSATSGAAASTARTAPAGKTAQGGPESGESARRPRDASTSSGASSRAEEAPAAEKPPGSDAASASPASPAPTPSAGREPSASAAPSPSGPSGPSPTLVDTPGAGPERNTASAEPSDGAQAAEENAAADIEKLESGQPEVLGPRCVACGTGAIDDNGYCDHCGHKQPAARDHMESELSSVAAASDRGLRHHRNEDFFAVAETTTADGEPAVFAVVCDGVSSATRSDEASATASRTARESVSAALGRGVTARDALHQALVDAAAAVTALAAEGPNEPSKNSPACTLVSALVTDDILTVGWIGDSRAYWIPEDRTASPTRLTEDDSWAAQMVAAGLLSEAEAYADRRAHAITGWLGADAYEVEPHTASFKPERPGVVVVCTDGLWNYAESAEEMAAAVPRDAARRPLHCVQRLVGYALDGGGHDNVTVAVVPFPLARAREQSA